MTGKSSSLSCCDELSIVLGAIKKGEDVRYLTVPLDEIKELEGIAHALVYNSNGYDIMLMDPRHYNTRHCEKCVLKFFIETKYYSDVLWNLLFQEQSRDFFRLSALMDIFGPKNNRLIMKKIIRDKVFFNTYFQYQCQRLMDFTTRFHSYLMQRTHAINHINTLFIMMKQRQITKRIAKNPTNMEYVVAILEMFRKESYERVKRLDKGFITKLEEVVMHILATIRNVDRRLFKRCTAKTNLRLSEYGNKQEKKLTTANVAAMISANLRMHNDRVDKENLIKCGNEECKTLSYGQHKYGTTAKDRKAACFCSRGCQKCAWNEKKVINKWFICKGCECVYYCSRHCQKVAWNRQGHKAFCRQL